MCVCVHICILFLAVREFFFLPFFLALRERQAGRYICRGYWISLCVRTYECMWWGLSIYTIYRPTIYVGGCYVALYIVYIGRIYVGGPYTLYIRMYACIYYYTHRQKEAK